MVTKKPSLVGRKRKNTTPDSEHGRCIRTDGREWRCINNAIPNENYCDNHMNRILGRSQNFMIDEPKRCKRTDGKKWRCNNNAIPNDIYCEKHMQKKLRGSTKSVECPINVSRSNVLQSDSTKVQKPSRSKKPTANILNRMKKIPTQPWILPDSPDCGFCGAKRFHGESPGFCCGSGKISVDLPKMPMKLWQLYTDPTSPASEHFRNRSRTYNNIFAFSSLGVPRYNTDYARGNMGVYTFKVQGIITHFMRGLIPNDNHVRHLQLYFYGTDVEVGDIGLRSNEYHADIVKVIDEVLQLNPYAIFFKSLRDFQNLDTYNIILRADPSPNPRVYNLPVVDHVAAIWNEGSEYSLGNPLDIRVYTRTNSTYNINYYYGCYDPLQYPLLFPFAEPGWHAGIKKTFNDNENSLAPSNHATGESLLLAEEQNLDVNRRRRGSISAREYYCYLFQIRATDVTSILQTGRVIQQFQVDMYIKLETQRLDYLRHGQKQKKNRTESYQGVVESMVSDGITRGGSIGQRVELPASFIGGPRDLRRRYMNALALVQKYGRPDFFITMTCNTNWPEIQEELLPCELAQNRADLLVRVFRAKNEELKRELIEENLLGEVAAYMYVIEFQKRGLPHVHWLIILKDKYKITSPEAYDQFVSRSK